VEPDLREFRRGYHTHIIHDEAAWRHVVRQKLLYQSTAGMVQLAKSPTNQAAYRTMLYGVPQVLVCNDWLNGATAADQVDVDWLKANSLVIHVQDYLYERD
jgi:hypothetical protein